MIALIDLYQKELLKVNGFSPSTVETYTINIKAFCRFAKYQLQIDPLNANGPQSPGKKSAALFPADSKTTAISNNMLQRIVKDQGLFSGTLHYTFFHLTATNIIF